MDLHADSASAPPAWIVMLKNDYQRWGGDLRRRSIFRRLAERTGAALIDGFSARRLRHVVGAGLWLMPLPMPFVSRAGPLPRLASSEMLRPDMVLIAKRVIDPAVVAVYDDPVAQTAALGMRMPTERALYFRRRRQANLETFRWHAVPSASFAELVGLDAERVIVAGNGTNVRLIQPGPWPAEPTIGMVSGAAPGRGIEMLIQAVQLVRQRIPEVQLRLWLVATGPESGAYLRDLIRGRQAKDWIQIGTAAYQDLGLALQTATLLAIPHPPGDYLDAALPVKLFDSMAAGRPLVITPRRETRAIVERHGAGVVAADDTPEAMAAAINGLLSDEAVVHEMGRAARDAAERLYDWPIVGDRLAVEILEREGLSPI